MIMCMEIADDTAGLVQQAKNGSRRAFTDLVRQHHATVRSYLARYLRDGAAADDLAQEVFLAAFRQLDEYRASAAFSAWLLGIARNQARSFLRDEVRRRRRVKKFAQAALAEWQAERLDTMAAAGDQHEQSLAALRSCIDQLPGESKSIVDQFYFGSKSAEAIASKTNKNSGAVRMMLMRIRRALGKCVTAKLRHGEY